ARPDVIDDLVENHYEPVQVTGVFTLDENDHPVKLTDVSAVETVDLSPLTIDAVVLEGQLLVPSPPLVLTPALDPETKQVLLASDEGLGLSAAAPTRDQLYEELVDEIAFVWEAYALEDDEILSPAAAELKKRLLERFQVSRDGV
ncbi:MAG: hypothetical protein Q8K99_02120, partial [Actinomycetota bacterium]|nr:hypothetical protein [Actinomycetota bacterium]